MKAPALPDRRLRAEPDQERRSRGLSAAQGALTQIPADTAASVNTPVFCFPSAVSALVSLPAVIGE